MEIGQTSVFPGQLWHIVDMKSVRRESKEQSRMDYRERIANTVFDRKLAGKGSVLIGALRD